MHTGRLHWENVIHSPWPWLITRGYILVQHHVHLISRVNMGPNIESMTNRADEPCSQGHAGTGLVLLTSQGSKHGIWLEVHSSTGIIPVAILGTCWVHLIQPKIWRCLRWLWNHPNILFGKRLFEATNLWYLMVHISEMPTSPWLPSSLDPRYHPPNQQFDPEQFANVQSNLIF